MYHPPVGAGAQVEVGTAQDVWVEGPFDLDAQLPPVLLGQLGLGADPSRVALRYVQMGVTIPAKAEDRG